MERMNPESEFPHLQNQADFDAAFAEMMGGLDTLGPSAESLHNVGATAVRTDVDIFSPSYESLSEGQLAIVEDGVATLDRALSMGTDEASGYYEHIDAELNPRLIARGYNAIDTDAQERAATMQLAQFIDMQRVQAAIADQLSDDPEDDDEDDQLAAKVISLDSRRRGITGRSLKRAS